MPKKILVVDDENLIRYALTAALRNEDTCTRSTSCGKDALAEIDRCFYDLCILDIHLPDMNGLAIMKTIKHVSPATQIIIMTGSEVDPNMMRAIQENAQLLMPKPFDLDRVKTFVEQVIGHKTPVYEARNQFYQDTDSVAVLGWLRDDKRRHERQAIMQSTVYSVVAADGGEEDGSFTASILDISDAGMCIRTDCRLKPGHLLKFSGNPAPWTGVVRWSMSAGTDDSYRAGIQFVMPESVSQQA